MAPKGKPAPAWNRPKMEPADINMSDDVSKVPAVKPPVAGHTGPVLPDRKPNAPFMRQVPGAAGKPMAPKGKPAPAWNRPKMEPTDINMSDDDHVSPNDLKSSIDPKLNESGEGHVHHPDCSDCSDTQVVQAFKSLEKWVKNGDDIDSL